MKSMLCPVLIDRSAELHTLTAALDRAEDGAGGALFLVGEAGVGKSRLVREISSLASARGLEVLIGRAAESAIPLPFRPIAEALMKVARTGVMPDAPELVNFRSVLGRLVPQWGQQGDGVVEVTPLMLGEALIRLLTPRGSKGVLLVLEDLHWADPETLAILEYLADNLAGTNVLAVATVRDSEPSAGLDLLRSISARRAATTIEVRRLHDVAVRKMARACLDTQDVPDEVLRLVAECDGLPFAVEEVLATAVASGQLVSTRSSWHVDERIAAGVPASIAGSVRNRLAALGPLVAGVLASAAVLGRKFDWTLLPRIADLADAEVLAALRQAQDMQLIEPIPDSDGLFRFRHSLTRHAILSGLLPPELVRRSASAAAAIESDHPDLSGAWCELAAELREAAGEHARAAELMLQAGSRALRQGALSTAIASLRDARDLAAAPPSAEPELAIEIEEALVNALALAGQHEVLAPVAEQLISKLDAIGADPRRQAQVRLRVARISCEEDPRSGAEHLSRARVIAECTNDAALSSQIDAVEARCALDAGDLDKADRLARRSLASAEAAGPGGWAAGVAFEALEVIGRRERVRDIRAAQAAFERAYQIASDNDMAVRRIAALHELGTIEMLEEGGTGRLREARDLAQRAGAISTLTIIDLQLANIWSLGTNLDQAMAAARDCEKVARHIRAHRVEAMAISTQALIHGIRANRREAELAAERAERVLPGDPELLLTTWGQGRVAASLFRNDIARALQESRTAIGYAEQVPQIAPRRAWGFYSLLEATCGDGGRSALKRARAAGAAAGWNRGLLAYAEAVLAGRDSRPERASELAREGDVQLRPYAAWWTHLIRRMAAPAAITDGWGEPAAWLREAAAEFDTSGHPQLASACRGILRRAGERVPRSGRGNAQVPPQMRRLGITSREMDVFLLVAHGCSNGEIAQRLFISPKTVETHIASLVAKTGQTGRRELVAHAARFVPS